MHRVLYLTYTLLFASAGVTFIFLEDLESELSISTFGLGIISSVGFLAGLVSALAASPLGDRGNLRSLGVTALLCGIVGNVWLAFADDLLEITAARAFASFGIGLFAVPARKALIGDSTDDSAQRIGAFVSAAVVGFLVGPSMGAQLERFGGMKTPYLTLAGGLVLLTPIVLTQLQRSPIATSHIGIGEMVRYLERPRIRAALAAQSAVFFNIGIFDSTVDEYLTDLGVGSTGVALSLLFIGSPLLIMPVFAGKKLDRTQRPHIPLLISFSVLTTMILLLGLFVGFAFFIVFAFVQATCEGVIFPGAARLAVDETGAAESAAGQGLLDAGGQLAAAFAALLGPTLYDLDDGPIGSFGLSALVSASLLFYANHQLRPTMRPTSPATNPNPTRSVG